jgi:hypothetical protein
VPDLGRVFRSRTSSAYLLLPSSGYPGLTQSQDRTGCTNRADFAELMIDCEEDRTLRAVLVGVLAEMDRK